MISGTVNHRREAVIRISIQNQAGQFIEFDGVIDTGFDGSLTLPKAVIDSLGLPWHGKSSTLLADGEIDEFDVFAGKTNWDGAIRNVLIEAAETDPLVGMAMMQGFELQVRIKPGGSLILRRIVE